MMIMIRAEEKAELESALSCIKRCVAQSPRGVSFTPIQMHRTSEGGWYSSPVCLVLAPNETRTKIVDALQKYLKEIDVGEELVVVDPYFLPEKNVADYATLVVDILNPFLATLKRIKIVTGQQKPPATLGKIQAHIDSVRSGIVASHHYLNKFHDRIWCSVDSGKCFLSGTSLNGLGKKYALLGHLADEDSVEVFNLLRANGVL